MNEDRVTTGWRASGNLIDLTEARERFGRTAEVDRDHWHWSPSDLRWLIRHWNLFRRDLDRAYRLGGDITAMAWNSSPLWYRAAVVQRRAFLYARTSTVRGIAWYLTDAPAPARVLTALCMLFAYAFMAGRY